jgi:hypothetical protein
MGYLLPRTKEEVAAPAWLAVTLVLWPFAAFFILQWKLYFSSDAHFWTFAVALVLGLPLSVLLLRRALYIAKLNLHPHYPPGHRFGMGQRLLAWLAITFIVYSLALALLSVHLLLAGHQSTVRVTVEKSADCGRGCSGCERTATVRSSLIHGRVCVDSLSPPPSAGSTVSLVGRYTTHAQFLFSVER